MQVLMCLTNPIPGYRVLGPDGEAYEKGALVSFTESIAVKMAARGWTRVEESAPVIALEPAADSPEEAAEEAEE